MRFEDLLEVYKEKLENMVKKIFITNKKEGDKYLTKILDGIDYYDKIMDLKLSFFDEEGLISEEIKEKGYESLCNLIKEEIEDLEEKVIIYNQIKGILI